jgi:hypothetical protein
VADTSWGTGTSVTGNQVVAALSDGGALFWGGQIFGPDQYSQIKITGAIGDWVGVSVRGKVVPAQGYWVAVKGDGTYLYSFVNAAFHVLAYDATLWATDDTLRLEVRTIAPNTARLLVYRNGVLLFSHDDASHFIASGQPGIGLYATTTIRLDDSLTLALLENPARARCTSATVAKVIGSMTRPSTAIAPNWPLFLQSKTTTDITLVAGVNRMIEADSIPPGREARPGGTAPLRGRVARTSSACGSRIAASSRR